MTSQSETAPFTVADAFRIAREGHAAQVDKSGKPYIGHIWRVMCGVEGETEKMVAGLHDYLEDVDAATPEGLVAMGVPSDVVDAVQALTKRTEEEGSNEGYFRFVRRAAENPLAQSVKRADLADNTDPERVRVFAETSQALADELRREAVDYRKSADAAESALADELRLAADQFEQKATEVEASPSALKAKYDEAIRILDGWTDGSAAQERASDDD